MTAIPRHGLARVLSKQGLCSRTEAARWIAAGRVAVDGRVVRDPEFPIQRGRQRIAVDGRDIDQAERLHLMLNKPRGLVTSARDERGRDTVYRCLDGAQWQGAPLPWLAPVGRLDQASEGLLLFCNDPEWAARITDPEHGPDKTYHVQIDTIPDADALAALVAGVVEDGEPLRAKSARLLRSGEKNAWLEIVLDEGRNRQIRRLLAAFDIGVLRLLRVAIGELALGELGKGQWRMLSAAEVARLSR
ncbi:MULTISPECIES: pseudouridine synthase [unclassified Lysobacter]|uniref:pseudouridine synthase n=1 Tax=unclassified Lysobacter TaxID=2635362 RepID=UPI0006FC24C9|nr:MULTISPECIES: pseudouridine synthase [unclassified Lysobacter]KQZ66256.1 pseudouridine synthase [Lysobacter sp. Root559]KRC30958.1 pseudouridine synthase [Lysobacter sp. Root76]KRD67746.1 pseudouridine synthase [Lysobacter sp. Root96]